MRPRRALQALGAAAIAAVVVSPVAGAARPAPAEVLALDVAAAHPEFHVLGSHELFAVRLVRDGAAGIGGVGTVVAARVRSSVLVVSGVCTVGGARSVPLDDVAAVARLHATSLAGAVLEHVGS